MDMLLWICNRHRGAAGLFALSAFNRRPGCGIAPPNARHQVGCIARRREPHSSLVEVVKGNGA